MLGVRPASDAVGAEGGLQPGDVGGRAQRGVDLHGAGERGPCLVAVVGVDEVPGRRLQCLRPRQRPAGLVIALRGGEQPGAVVVEQAAAVQRVRLPVRDLRLGREGVGAAGERLRGAQVAGLGGQPDGVGQQVLDLLDFFGIAVERIGQRGQRLG